MKRKYIFIKEVGDTNPDRVINNIFDFVTEVYDYASSNERYKPYQANIVLFIKTKAGIEVVPIMHSYLFNDRIEEQLRFMVIAIRRSHIPHSLINKIGNPSNPHNT